MQRDHDHPEVYVGSVLGSFPPPSAADTSETPAPRPLLFPPPNRLSTAIGPAWYPATAPPPTTTGCWHSALIQALILHEFGVLYSIHYVSELLRNLGFSYQKARFVSDHLNHEKRQTWLNETWASIVQTARRKGALLLFADEASFAQWGSLGYT